MKKWKIATTAVFCSVLWGMAFPIMKVLYSSFNVSDGDTGKYLMLAGVRFTLAGILMLTVELVRKNRPMRAITEKPIEISLYGLVYTTLQYSLFYISAAMIPSGRASLINTSNAFISVIIAGMFFREDRLNFQKTIGAWQAFSVCCSYTAPRVTEHFPGAILSCSPRRSAFLSATLSVSTSEMESDRLHSAAGRC